MVAWETDQAVCAEVLAVPVKQHGLIFMWQVQLGRGFSGYIQNGSRKNFLQIQVTFISFGSGMCISLHNK